MMENIIIPFLLVSKFINYNSKFLKLAKNSNTFIRVFVSLIQYNLKSNKLKL